MFFTSKDLKNLSKKSTEIACGKSRMVKKSWSGRIQTSFSVDQTDSAHQPRLKKLPELRTE